MSSRFFEGSATLRCCALPPQRAKNRARWGPRLTTFSGVNNASLLPFSRATARAGRSPFLIFLHGCFRRCFSVARGAGIKLHDFGGNGLEVDAGKVGGGDLQAVEERVGQRAVDLVLAQRLENLLEGDLDGVAVLKQRHLF